MEKKKQQKVQQLGCVFLCVLCMLIWAPHGQAQNVTDWINDQDQEIKDEEAPTEPVQDDTGQEPSFIWSLIKLVGILVIMIGFLYAAVRFFSKRNRQMRDLNILENLGGIPVGQQKSIQLIRVGRTYYMIGVGDNVELLQVIEDEGMIKELDLLSEEPKEDGIFSAFTRLKQMKDEKDTPSSFTHIYEKELDSIVHNRKKMIRSYQKREEENE